MLHMYKKALNMQNHRYRHCVPRVRFPPAVNIHPQQSASVSISRVKAALSSKICTQERFCTHVLFFNPSCTQNQTHNHTDFTLTGQLSATWEKK